MSRLGYALALAELGYPVLPIRSGSKRPACAGGLRAATTDPDRLAELFDRPGLNLAIVAPEGVLVLDADAPGVARALVAEYRELEVAPCVSTPRGGRHFFVAVDPGAVPSARVGALPSVDLRGLGRTYVLSPPSVTAVGCYVWRRGLVAPAALPAASSSLLRALVPDRPAARSVVPARSAPGRYAFAALRRELDAVGRAGKGSRNDTLNRAAFNLGQLAGEGLLSPHVARRGILRAAARAGLSALEAQATLDSGWWAGVASPRNGGAQEAGSPREARASAVAGAPSSVRSPAPAQPARTGPSGSDRSGKV